MKIWVDGDSCHRLAMERLLKAAGRKEFELYVVADRIIPAASSGNAQMIVLGAGEGTADEYLLEQARPADAAVTRDLELAMRLLQKGLTVMNDCGRIWTKAALSRRLEDSRLMLAMRRGGMAARRTAAYTAKDAGNFAQSLDKLLSTTE